jgi:hypothetical protein
MTNALSSILAYGCAAMYRSEASETIDSCAQTPWFRIRSLVLIHFNPTSRNVVHGIHQFRSF